MSNGWLVIVIILILLLSGCVSDQQACSGQTDYWSCMNYYQAQRGASQAAMSQAATAQINAATRPVYVWQPTSVCGPFGCY